MSGPPLSRARQHLLAPPLGRLDLVEREHVQSGDFAVRRREVRQEPSNETLGAVAARLHHPQEPVGVSAQETAAPPHPTPAQPPHPLPPLAPPHPPHLLPH